MGVSRFAIDVCTCWIRRQGCRLASDLVCETKMSLALMAFADEVPI
jgi:hypothetical protein